MKQRKILSWIMVLMLALSFSISAFAQEVQPTVQPAAQRADDEVVARAFGKDILYKDIQLYYNQLVYMYGSQYGIDPSTDAQMKAYLEQMATSMAISYEALKKVGEEKGIHPFAQEKIDARTAEVQESYKAALAQYTQSILGEKENPTDEEKAAAEAQAVIALIGDDTTTPEEFINENVEAALNQDLYEAVFAEITKDVDVTDEEIKATFDETVASQKEEYKDSVYNYEIAQYSGTTSYYRPAGYRAVSHILLTADEELLKTYQELQAMLEEQNNEDEIAAQAETQGQTEATVVPEQQEEPVTPEQLEEARLAIISSVQATVDEIMGKLEAGEPFASLIEQYGTDPGMTAEPSKTEGYAVNIESVLYDSAFVAGAFSEKMQNPGDVSDPVVSSFGVHILNYLKELPEGQVEYTEEIKQSLKESTLTQKKQDVFNTYLNEWIEKGAVEFLIGEETQQEQQPEQETPAQQPAENEAPAVEGEGEVPAEENKQG